MSHFVGDASNMDLLNVLFVGDFIDNDISKFQTGHVLRSEV